MMDLPHQNLRRLALLAGAVLALIVLGAGLSGLEFRPGTPFQLLWERAPFPIGGSGGATDSSIFDLVWRVMVFVFLVTLPVAIIYFIVSAEARKRVLRDLLVMLSFAILYLAFVRAIREGEALDVTLPNAPAPAPTPGALSPNFAPQPSDLLVLVASLGVALLLVGLLIGTVWYVRRPSASPLDRLAEEAQETLQQLRAGGDFKNAVVRCYAEMSRILREQRGIQRQAGMTPREFERHLAELGLPPRDVRRLTRLFEDARYGAREPDAADRREAETCLMAIVHAAGDSA